LSEFHLSQSLILNLLSQKHKQKQNFQTQQYSFNNENYAIDKYEDFLKFFQCLLKFSQAQPITNLCLYQIEGFLFYFLILEFKLTLFFFILKIRIKSFDCFEKK
jgi:hypothetical protein